MKKPLTFLALAVFGSLLSMAAHAQDTPRGIVNIKGLQAASSGTKTGAGPLIVAVPSAAFSESSDSLYRPGYELELLKKSCALIKIKCSPKMVDEDPRTTPLMTMSGGPSGVDAILWGSDIRVNKRATNEALMDAIGSLGEGGELAQIKRRFMKIDRAWPRAISVGIDSKTAEQAKELCQAIRAQCTFTTGKDFSALAKRFDGGEFQWVAHSQSWLFQSKDLEDRITTAMEDLEHRGD